MLEFFQRTASVSSLHRQQRLWPIITLGVSASWRHGAGRLDWIAANGLACAYAPNPEELDFISGQLTAYLKRGMAIRHHGYFPGAEIGHAHPIAAEAAMRLHFKAMEAIQGLGERLMTVHLGLDQTLPLDHRRAVQNLTRLVRYGQKIGVAISLENLRRGPTANPDTLLEWARRAGAAITLDVGHAVSSECVCRGETSVGEIIDLISERIAEVHLYESETDRHWAPRSMEILGPIVDKLITVDCPWWTIELEDTGDVLQTRQLLSEHFRKTDQPVHWRPETEVGCVMPG